MKNKTLSVIGIGRLGLCFSLTLEKAGFNVEVINSDNWDKAPIARKKLAEEFSEIEDEELLISGFDVILKPTD